MAPGSVASVCVGIPSIEPAGRRDVVGKACRAAVDSRDSFGQDPPADAGRVEGRQAAQPLQPDPGMSFRPVPSGWRRVSWTLALAALLVPSSPVRGAQSEETDAAYVSPDVWLPAFVVWVDRSLVEEQRIAAKYAKLDSLSRSGVLGEQRLAERQKLKGQIADLKQQMLAP